MTKDTNILCNSDDVEDFVKLKFKRKNYYVDKSGPLCHRPILASTLKRVKDTNNTVLFIRQCAYC